MQLKQGCAGQHSVADAKLSMLTPFSRLNFRGPLSHFSLSPVCCVRPSFKAGKGGERLISCENNWLFFFFIYLFFLLTRALVLCIHESGIISPAVEFSES